MKTTMSKRNIARMNTYLKKGMKMEEVSKHLKVDVKTLKHFSEYKPKAPVAEKKEAPKVVPTK